MEGTVSGVNAKWHMIFTNKKKTITEQHQRSLNKDAIIVVHELQSKDNPSI